MAEHGAGIQAAIPVIAAILITCAIGYVILRSAQQVKKVLRFTGIAILERIFGLILAAIAVQFIFEGSKTLLHQ